MDVGVDVPFLGKPLGFNHGLATQTIFFCFYIFKIILCMYVSMCEYVHVCANALRTGRYQIPWNCSDMNHVDV